MNTTPFKTGGGGVKRQTRYNAMSKRKRNDLKARIEATRKRQEAKRSEKVWKARENRGVKNMNTTPTINNKLNAAKLGPNKGVKRKFGSSTPTANNPKQKVRRYFHPYRN